MTPAEVAKARAAGPVTAESEREGKVESPCVPRSRCGSCDRRRAGGGGDPGRVGSRGGAAPRRGRAAAAGDWLASPRGAIARSTGSRCAGPIATRWSASSWPVDVPAFELARFPVTNAEYLAFVTAHPKWRRSRVSKLFADASYLRHWRGDLDPGPRAPARSPVVHVSWFAARAYAAAHGLPPADGGRMGVRGRRRRDAPRRVARSGVPRPDPHFRLAADARRPSRRWAGASATCGASRTCTAWSGSGRSTSTRRWSRASRAATPRSSARCTAASGASNAGDFADYAAFMRFAYRASLEAKLHDREPGIPLRAGRGAARGGIDDERTCERPCAGRPPSRRRLVLGARGRLREAGESGRGARGVELRRRPPPRTRARCTNWTST